MAGRVLLIPLNRMNLTNAVILSDPDTESAAADEGEGESKDLHSHISVILSERSESKDLRLFLHPSVLTNRVRSRILPG